MLVFALRQWQCAVAVLQWHQPGCTKARAQHLTVFVGPDLSRKPLMDTTWWNLVRQALAQLYDEGEHGG